MNKKVYLSVIIPVFALLFATPSASVSADNSGPGYGRSFGGMTAMHRVHQGGNDLMPPGLHNQFHEDCHNMTEEEHAEMWEARKMHQESQQEAIEEFTGLTRDEIRELHRSGESVGDILEGRGISESDAEAFLTEQANERVDWMVAQHNLNEEDEQTLRDRIADFVKQMLERWFL